MRKVARVWILKLLESWEDFHMTLMVDNYSLNTFQ